MEPEHRTVECTFTGLEFAYQPGMNGACKRWMTDCKILSTKKLLSNGVPPRNVPKDLGVSVPTIYRWLPASNNP